MEDLEKEFVVYPLAYRMKKLDFDKPCFGYFLSDGMFINEKISKQTGSAVSAPTWQSAFDWFRKKYNLFSEIDLDSYKEPYLLKITIKQLDETNYFVTNSYYPNCINGKDTFSNKQYEEAELACLEKLLEIAEMIELAKVVEKASNELNKK